MNKIKTLLIASGEFTIPLLKELLDSENFELVGVVTQPDKPAGRDKILTPTPVREYLLNHNMDVEIWMPDKIRLESQKILDYFKPELIIVSSYGQIIPQDILDYPKYKSLNFHGSILPKLRGAVPVNFAILQDFKETGVTMQQMVYKMDEGPIIAVRKYELQPDETAESLMCELGLIAGIMTKEDLPKYISDELKPAEQQGEATYCYKDDIAKEKAEITFETDINLAERMTRAFYPWPIAWVNLNGKILKIYKSAVSLQPSAKSEYLRIRVADKKLFLDLKNGSLELLEVQLEGKKRDTYKNYLFLGSI